MPNELSLRLKCLHRAVHCSRLFLTRARSNSVRAVPHATAQLMSLALPDSSVRCKRHESVMDSAMNTALGRGSAMSANVRAMKDALMPVRLHRANSLRIAWEEPTKQR